MDYILFCVFHVWWVRTWKVKCMYEIRWRRKAQRCIRDYICYACFSLSLFFIVKQLLLWMNIITYVRHNNNSHIWCSAWIDNEIEKMWDEMWKRRRKNEMRIFCWLRFSFMFSILFFIEKLFYVRAPQQYVAPSGVGTIKLSYTSNQAQPQTTIQYASTTPKVTNSLNYSP